MALDFEALRDATTDPPASKGEAAKQRKATLGQLFDLHVPEEIIAVTCGVQPTAVQTWRKETRVPRSFTAKIALDRLHAIIGHMRDDLGLTDRAISNFLINEPHVLPEDRDDGFYDQWDPDRDAFEESPIMTNVSAYSGVAGVAQGPEAFQARLALRFPERQVEAQAGVVATPETVA